MPHGNHQTTTQRIARKTLRLAWLEADPALLARLPSANDDVDEAASEALDEALRRMKLVQLYAASAAPITVRWGRSAANRSARSAGCSTG